LLCGNYGEGGAINYYSAHRNIAAVALSGDCYKQFFGGEKTAKKYYFDKSFDNPDTALTRRRHLFKIALSVKQIENIY
jgi:hypothetical protein